MRFSGAALLSVTLAAAAPAQTLATPLAGIGFLVGHWDAGQGQITETGGTSKGSSVITAEAGGHALLRRDHTDLFDKTGKPAGSFDQIMLIYPEGGTLHADYSDGTHVIHYTGAEVTPGKAVTFTSVGPGPVFQLRYALTAPATLAIHFGMTLPGGRAVQPIATGTLIKTP